jgi:hypothetical protein
MMKMSDVRKKAKELGVKPGKLRKADLIRTIQAQEGNSQCYQSGLEFCDQDGCCWRSDCLQ